jgi:mannitol/fructose-specific phosphotransferase system IIA component (Ntr-type)
MTHKEFVSYFAEDLFIPDLKALDKTIALEQLVDHLVEKKRVKNGKIVLEALKKRESLGSTGIGKSLAVPHGRTTVTGSLTVLYARSVKGIPWDSLDGKPVHFVVLILAPHQEKDNHYLPLLGKVVEFARDATVRRKLMQVDTHAGLLEVLTKTKAS